MTFNTRCKVCRKNSWITAKWPYRASFVVTGMITPDVEVCWACHQNNNALILGNWSIRHYYLFIKKYAALVKKHGKLEGGGKESWAELQRQIPPTMVGTIAKWVCLLCYYIPITK